MVVRDRVGKGKVVEGDGSWEFKLSHSNPSVVKDSYLNYGDHLTL